MTAGKTLKVRSHSSNVRRSHPSKPKIANTTTIYLEKYRIPGLQIQANKNRNRALVFCPRNRCYFGDRPLGSLFGKELFHLTSITLARYQKTGLVHSGDRADPGIALNGFPFAVPNLNP